MGACVTIWALALRATGCKEKKKKKKKEVGLRVFVCHQLTLAYTSPIIPAVHPGVLSYRPFFSPPHKNVEQKFCPLFFFLLHFFSPPISPRFHSFSFRAAGSCPNSDATSLANMYNTETNGIPLSKEGGGGGGGDRPCSAWEFNAQYLARLFLPSSSSHIRAQSPVRGRLCFR